MNILEEEILDKDTFWKKIKEFSGFKKETTTLKQTTVCKKEKLKKRKGKLLR